MALRIEIFERKEGILKHRIYEIDEECGRILVDKEHNPEVWGFIETSDPNQPIQVSGKLLSKKETQIYA